MKRLAVLIFLLPLLAHAEVLSSATCIVGDTSGCFTRNTSGFSSVFLDISGTWVGEVVVEVAGSSSGPWRLARVYPLDGNEAYTTSITSNGSWTVPTGGAPVLRVRFAARTSGSVTATAQASTAPVPTDIIRAVGPTFGAVLVAGIVEANLSESSIAALNPALIYPDLPPAPTLTTTVTTLDDPTITNRTELTVRNIANGNLRLWCCRGASCTPTATAAYILLAGDTFRFEGIRDSDTIRCRAATDPVQVNYVEVSQ